MGTKTIWDGKDLPRIGDEVLIQLASEADRKTGKGGWVRHKVAGYKVAQITDPKMSDINRRFHVRLDIIVDASDDPRSWKNERSYNDVKPVDWQEPK